MTPEHARDLADQVLLALLQDPELVQDLLRHSGLPSAQLRQTLQEPGAAEFVLDYAAQTDDRLRGLAEALGVDVARLAAAARCLREFEAH